MSYIPRLQSHRTGASRIGAAPKLGRRDAASIPANIGLAQSLRGQSLPTMHIDEGKDIEIATFTTTTSPSQLVLTMWSFLSSGASGKYEALSTREPMQSTTMEEGTSRMRSRSQWTINFWVMTTIFFASLSAWLGAERQSKKSLGSFDTGWNSELGESCFPSLWSLYTITSLPRVRTTLN